MIASTWHWTWQDPVALALAGLGLVVVAVRWARATRAGACGCHGCPANDPDRFAPRTTRPRA